MNKVSIRSRIMIGNWYVMPVAVLVLGIISTGLLFWTTAIIEKQHMNFAFLSSLEDLQIRASTAHFMLEEAITLQDTAKAERAMRELDHAVRLSEAIMQGGKSDHGLFLSPLTNSAFRKPAEDVRRLLYKFRDIAQERRLDPRSAKIGSDIDKSFDMVFAEFRHSAETLDTLFQNKQVSYNLKTDRLIFWIFLVWSLIIIGATIGLSTRELKKRHAEEELLKVNRQLLSKTVELREHREHLSELVATRTSELTATNERLRTEIAERTRAEAALKESALQLQYLSDRLMTAQETERRHISKELHDEFGHSLALMKMRINSIRNGLPDHTQGAIEDDFKEIMSYMDDVIENVRDLSRELSPSILEDIGLTAALQWLIDNFRKGFDGNVSSDLEDIDHLFSGGSRIMIYRILQEALTNIGKHSGAKNMSLVVRETGDAVSFLIEDDGRGFKALPNGKCPAKPGLGLIIMQERVRMLGGVLEIRAQEGKGTRISFSVPAGLREKYALRSEGGKDAR
ncbi:MAG: sensor histidine kinase [Nitrospirae bacterium]|nr:sensor histidine kinase [Nitrospirota bacterium]